MTKEVTLAKYLTASLIFLSLVSNAQSNYLCKMQDDKNAVVATQAQHLEGFNWVSNTKNLIFIGDEHNNSNPADIANIFTKIKNAKNSGDKTCLFLEFSSSMSVEEFKKILNDTYSSAESLSYRKYYRTILNFAEASGFSIMLADHPKYFESEKTINERDEAIAQNIFAAFRSRSCDLGVMVIGKAHLSPDEYNRVLVRDNLKSLGIDSTAINLQYANERVIQPMLKSWNQLCPQKPTPITTPVIFKNNQIREYSVYPLYTGLMKFGYFDFTILFP